MLSITASFQSSCLLVPINCKIKFDVASNSFASKSRKQVFNSFDTSGDKKLSLDEIVAAGEDRDEAAAMIELLD